LKRLYWQVHQPRLVAETDASAFAIMEQGREVGLLARQLFPGGVEVSGFGLDKAIRNTRELIANPDVPAIFEGTFENGGVIVKVDILQRRQDNRWHLFEVKSSTGLKEEHLDDVGIQARVVSRCGIDLASSCFLAARMLAAMSRTHFLPSSISEAPDSVIVLVPNATVAQDRKKYSRMFSFYSPTTHGACFGGRAAGSGGAGTGTGEWPQGGWLT